MKTERKTDIFEISHSFELRHTKTTEANPKVCFSAKKYAKRGRRKAKANLESASILPHTWICQQIRTDQRHGALARRRILDSIHETRRKRLQAQRPFQRQFQFPGGFCQSCDLAEPCSSLQVFPNNRDLPGHLQPGKYIVLLFSTVDALFTYDEFGNFLSAQICHCIHKHVGRTRKSFTIINLLWKLAAWKCFNLVAIECSPFYCFLP